MYYRISNCIKKIIIKELQDLFLDHPIFGDNNLVVTNKFQFNERPKYAIVVKTSTADSLKLSLDNFKGIVKAYTTLANLKNKSGRMIEWVKEDLANVKNLVKPGFYIVEMIEDEKFVVKPFLTVSDELLEIEINGFKHVFLKYKNVNPGSECILGENALKLQVNNHYTIDYNSGEIVFLKDISDFGELVIDYQYLLDEIGPFDVKPETVNITAIPGVLLAFGNFIKKGGLQVVVVYPERQDVAEAFLGKWKMNVNFSIVAQDTDTQEQLADLTAMYIWSILQDKLVNDGISVLDINIGGESEEDEVQTSNEMSFLADLSMSIEVEWEAYRPILGVVKKIFLNKVEDFGQYDDPEFSVRNEKGVNKSLRGVDYKMGLQPVESFVPYVVRPVQPYTLISSRVQI